MNWKIKAMLQKILALTKFGDNLNHLPVLFNKKYHSNVFQYQTYECLRKVNQSNVKINDDSIALEIGTGYSVISPICLSLLGFKQIVTVDITKDINFASFKKQVQYFEISNLPIGFISKSVFSKEIIDKKIKILKKVKSLGELFDYLNILYLAPYKFEDIENVSHKFDYIASQVVLEHMPPDQLNLLFSYTKKWLTHNGVAVHCINFIDHFVNPGFFQDKSISEFNFLKYSDKYWSFWSGNSIAYTNRLSYLFYIQLAKLYDLNIVSFIGENYRERIELDVSLIHPDILKKYNHVENIKELIKYQRGTIVLNIV